VDDSLERYCRFRNEISEQADALFATYAVHLTCKCGCSRRSIDRSAYGSFLEPSGSRRRCAFLGRDGRINIDRANRTVEALNEAFLQSDDGAAYRVEPTPIRRQ
jgi:hypothetical protein